MQIRQPERKIEDSIWKIKMGEQNDKIFTNGKINEDVLFSIITERTIQGIALGGALVVGSVIGAYIIKNKIFRDEK
jgi:hypothetical protein